MSHFALIENGVVASVIVAEQDFIDTQSGTWLQTSYNTHGGVHLNGGTPFRKNYANEGMIYDTVRDAFYAPQPYPSWSLNGDSCIWESPTAYPDDGLIYGWDEERTAWVQL